MRENGPRRWGIVLPLMQPAEALATCEQALRRLISTVLADKLGQNWIEKAFTAERVEAFRKTREEESGRRTRRGVAAVPTEELAYVQFFDMLKLVQKYWDHLRPALGNDQKEMMGLLGRFEALRNSVAHSRDLLPFEEELLSGIAGEIRNRVTIFMSSQDPVGEYFARIDSVTDSFGHCVQSSRDSVDTGKLLHPGDTVRFRCRGTDPQGRKLRWSMLAEGDDGPSVVGRDVELVWHITDQHIAQETRVIIYMESDSPYHRVKVGRGNGYDDTASFVYRVLPLVPRP